MIGKPRGQLDFDDRLLQMSGPPDGVEFAAWLLFLKHCWRPDPQEFEDHYCGSWPTLDTFLEERFDIEFGYFAEDPAAQQWEWEFEHPLDESFKNHLMMNGVWWLQSPSDADKVYIFEFP